jgi:hypothetical protein
MMRSPRARPGLGSRISSQVALRSATAKTECIAADLRPRKGRSFFIVCCVTGAPALGLNVLGRLRGAIAASMPFGPARAHALDGHLPRYLQAGYREEGCGLRCRDQA